MKKMLPVFILLFGLSFMLTACGESKNTAELNVELLDIQFRPNEFTVPASAEVTFTAHNYGLAPHDFIIFKKGFDAGAHFDYGDDANIYWRMELQPGQAVTESFTAPTAPGEYFVACGIGEHMESGMVGKLIVVE